MSESELDIKRSEQREHDIIYSYLKGDSKDSIAKKYNIEKRDIEGLVERNATTRTTIEKTLLRSSIIKENKYIEETKERMFQAVNETLKSFIVSEDLTEKEKINLLDVYKSWYDTLDRSFRLNNDLVTSREEVRTQNTNLDIAKLADQISTEEDKKSFLLNQLRPS